MRRRNCKRPAVGQTALVSRVGSALVWRSLNSSISATATPRRHDGDPTRRKGDGNATATWRRRDAMATQRRHDGDTTATSAVTTPGESRIWKAKVARDVNAIRDLTFAPEYLPPSEQLFPFRKKLSWRISATVKVIGLRGSSYGLGIRSG